MRRAEMVERIAQLEAEKSAQAKPIDSLVAANRDLASKVSMGGQVTYIPYAPPAPVISPFIAPQWPYQQPIITCDKFTVAGGAVGVGAHQTTIWDGTIPVTNVGAAGVAVTHYGGYAAGCAPSMAGMLYTVSSGSH